MVSKSAKKLWANMRYPIRYEVEKGTTKHACLRPVAPGKEHLERPEQESAGEKWDEQPVNAFTPELSRRAAPQGKPTRSTGHQEEQRHPPGIKERGDNKQRVAALLVNDLEIHTAEYADDMEEIDAQRGKKAKPVQIIQASWS